MISRIASRGNPEVRGDHAGTMDFVIPSGAYSWSRENPCLQLGVRRESGLNRSKERSSTGSEARQINTTDKRRSRPFEAFRGRRDASYYRGVGVVKPPLSC